MLYFKGFHAIQTHRLAHWLWNKGRKDFAYYLQSRSSAVFQTDINPAARIGRGIFLDHATGLVVGETAVIEDDVSILHGVTLGGTGKEDGDRHPKIRHGVLIGAGAKILGNIEVGHCARIAAGSVVLKPVPHNTTVAGVPAKVVGEAGCPEPSRTMDQLFQHLDRDRRRCLERPPVPRFDGRKDEEATWTSRKSGSSTPISSVCSATRASAWCPKKDDSAEVFIGEEFIGVLFDRRRGR